MKIRNKYGEFCTAREFWDELTNGSVKILECPFYYWYWHSYNYAVKADFESEINKFKIQLSILSNTAIDVIYSHELSDSKIQINPNYTISVLRPETWLDDINNTIEEQMQRYKKHIINVSEYNKSVELLSTITEIEEN